MNEMSQLANAIMVLVFAAVMFVVGQQYIESRSAKLFNSRVAQASRRVGFAGGELSPSFAASVDRHNEPDRQLALRLAKRLPITLQQ